MILPNLQCPKCQETENFWIHTTVPLLFHQGVPDDVHLEHPHFDLEAKCSCHTCGQVGSVKSFVFTPGILAITVAVDVPGHVFNFIEFDMESAYKKVAHYLLRYAGIEYEVESVHHQNALEALYEDNYQEALAHWQAYLLEQGLKWTCRIFYCDVSINKMKKVVADEQRRQEQASRIFDEGTEQGLREEGWNREPPSGWSEEDHLHGIGDDNPESSAGGSQL